MLPPVAVPDDIFAYYCGSESACRTVIGAGNPDGSPASGACLTAPPPPPPDGCGDDVAGSPKTIATGINRYQCRGRGLEWADTMPADWNQQTQGPWYPAQTPPDKCGFDNFMDRNGRKTVGNMACPSPSHLDSSGGGRFTGFTLPGDVHIGGRSDLNTWRHFNGRMAGVAIAGEAKTEISCLYGCGIDSLPGIATYEADVCGTITTPLVKAPLTSARCSGSSHVATGSCAMFGAQATAQYQVTGEYTAQGARFDGTADYIEIPSIDYGADATFTINFWFTKGTGDGTSLSGQEGCTDNLYEYMYSHNERPTGSITSYENLGGAGSNVNIYMGCDSSARVGSDGQPIAHTAGYATCGHDTGYRSAPGTVLRVNLLDSGSSLTRRAEIPADYCAAGGVNAARTVEARANWAMFDISLHNAGSFDQLTTRWVHFALTVTPSKVAVYLDGIEQDQFCFFDPQPAPPPPALPTSPFIPPPPPPLNQYGAPCPPTPPTPTVPVYCQPWMDCGASICGAPAPPGLNTLPPPPPPPVDVQDSRLNIAYPTPGSLYNVFNKFALNGPITIGGRSDHSPLRHFKGGMRSVAIYSSALSKTEVNCIFTMDDAIFSGAIAAPAAAGAAVAQPTMVLLIVTALAMLLRA